MPTSRLRGVTALLSICAIAACTSDLPTGVVVKDLAGSWTKLDEVPGSSEHWVLSTQDTVVTGTGTWSAEACCGGTLTASGYVHGDSLHLEVTYLTDPRTGPRDPYAAHFNGMLTSPNTLVGDGGRFKKD
jgi:hypothetical protein